MANVDAGVIEWWRDREQGKGWDGLQILHEDAMRIPSLFPAMMVPTTLFYIDPPYLRSVRTRLIRERERESGSV